MNDRPQPPPGPGATPSRRRFIGLAAAVVAVPAAAVTVDKLATSSAATSDKSGNKRPTAPTRRPLAENSHQGDPNWRIRHLGKPEAMLGYAGQASVLQGQPITLYASTTARSFQVHAFRMGWYNGDRARLVWSSPRSIRGFRQRPATLVQPTRTVEADWGPSLMIPTDGWPEGSYLLRLDSEAGAQRYVPVTVRSASTRGKLVIKNCNETWQAYNTWGGYNLYNGPGGAADYSNRSLAVSFDRPYDANGAYMFLWHEQKFIALAEQTGLPLAYTTSVDIDADPHLLDGANALFSLGHDEYWTPPERAHVTAARDAGVNLAFLGANCLFRRTRMAGTRLGAGLVICYKTSYQQDPMFGKDNALVTSDWREPPHPDPESSLIGTLYESNPVDAAYVVAAPDAWMFRGTGVHKGSRFTGLVGIEYDRVNPVWPVQRPMQVLSHSPLTCRGTNSYSDSAYYTNGSGAGVFTAGTMRWVASMGGLHSFGLTDRTAAFTRQVTTNILHAFADGPAAAKYPAEDNLKQLQEWPGDPIAAGHNLWPPVRL